LWTSWSPGDARLLQTVIEDAAKLWARWLPDFSLSWFDAKIAELARLQKMTEPVRCGFGDGEIAVAPSGRLYPCERLIGEDRPGNPLCLSGNALDGDDFLDASTCKFTRCAPCSQCALAFACDTFCRCSNFIRTGDTNRPDSLLCTLNKAVALAVADVLGDGGRPANSPFRIITATKENCYV
jgi:radical SAM protein with 4Fe4S-binding SPASM domain